MLFCMLNCMMRTSRFLCLITFCLVAFVSRAASAKPRPIALLSAVPMGAYIRGASNSQPGFIEILNEREFISTKPGNYPKMSTIDFWDLRRSQIIKRIIPPQKVNSGSVRISSDNKRIIALSDASFGGTQKLYVWQLLNKKLIRTFNFGNRVFLDNVIFLPGQSRIALVKVRDIKKIRYKGRWETITDQKQHSFYIDIESGQKIFNERSAAAKFLEGDYFNRNSVQISPDQKRIINIYEAGEGSYNSIEVASVQTGKIVARFQGNYDIELSGKGFFLSNEQLLFGSWRSIDTDDAPMLRNTNLILNLRTGQTRVCAPPLAHLKCLGGIASRPGWGFFASSQGVELWNMPQMKLVHRWAHIKHIEDVYISRSQKVVGFYYWKEAPSHAQGAVALDENGIEKLARSETLQFWTLP